MTTILVKNLATKTTPQGLELYLENRSNGAILAEMDIRGAGEGRVAVVKFDSEIDIKALQTQLSKKPYDDNVLEIDSDYDEEEDLYTASADSFMSPPVNTPVGKRTSAMTKSTSPTTPVKEPVPHTRLPGTVLTLVTPMTTSPSVAHEICPGSGDTRPKVVHTDSSPEKALETEMAAININKPAPVKEEKQIKAKKDQIKLFKLCEIENESYFRDVDIKLYDSLEQILLMGAKENIMTASVYIYELLNKVQMVYDSISPNLASGFAWCLKREDVIKSLQEAINERSLKVVLSPSECKLGIYALDSVTAQSAVTIMKVMITKKEIPLDDDCKRLKTSRKFQEQQKSLQNQFKVAIGWKHDERILIEGIKGDVDEAAKQIEEYLKHNTIITKTVKMDAGVCQYLHGSDKGIVEEACHNPRYPDMKVKVNWVRNGTVSIEGCKEMVKTVEDIVKQLKGCVCQEKVEINKPGMDKFFSSDNGKGTVKSFEAKRKCRILMKCNMTAAPSVQKHHRSSSPDRSKGAEAPRKGTSSSVVKSGVGLTINQTSISVHQGDITKQRASVLVNVLVRRENLLLEKNGAISQAFHRAGADQLQQALSSIKAHGGNANYGDIFYTPVADIATLQCDAVYHAMCPRYQQQYGTQIIEEVVAKCLMDVKKHNVSSIAFCALGCGAILRFPPEKVAPAMLDATVKFLKENSRMALKNVYIVIFDDPTVRIFKDALNNYNEGGHSNSRDRHHHSAAQQSPPPQSLLSRSPSDPVLFTIYGEKRAAGLAKQDIYDLVRKQYKEETIQDEAIKTFSKERNDAMFKLSALQSVTVKEFDYKKGLIKICGDDLGVTKAGKEIYKFMTKQVKSDEALPDIKDIEQKKGRKAALKAMAEMDSRLPDYWTSFVNLLKPIRLLLTGFQGARFKKFDIHKGTTEFNAICSLVNKTWSSDKVGQGRDARNLRHRNIDISKIQRVENVDLYKKYADCKAQFLLRAAKNEMGPMHKCKTIKVDQILTTKVGVVEMDRRLVEEINEAYLFHGTQPDNVDIIVKQGLDTRIAEPGAGMFGSGLYAAESCTKADQYSDPRDNRATTERKIFLVRMLLGRTYATSQATNDYRRPPCSRCNKKVCKDHHELYDSVIGGAGTGAGPSLLFREFVVYDNAQCYPEYIISYVRK